MNQKKGFTLIELFIVMSIIGIIAAIAVPNIVIAVQRGKFVAMKQSGVIEKGYTLIKAVVNNDYATQVYLPELKVTAELHKNNDDIGLLRKEDLIQVLMRKNANGLPRHDMVFFWRKLEQARTQKDTHPGASRRSFFKAIIMSDDATVVRISELEGNVVVYPALITELKVTILVSADGLSRTLWKDQTVTVSFDGPLNSVKTSRQIARIESLE